MNSMDAHIVVFLGPVPTTWATFCVADGSFYPVVRLLQYLNTTNRGLHTDWHFSTSAKCMSEHSKAESMAFGFLQSPSKTILIPS